MENVCLELCSGHLQAASVGKSNLTRVSGLEVKGSQNTWGLLDSGSSFIVSRWAYNGNLSFLPHKHINRFSKPEFIDNVAHL